MNFFSSILYLDRGSSSTATYKYQFCDNQNQALDFPYLGFYQHRWVFVQRPCNPHPSPIRSFPLVPSPIWRNKMIDSAKSYLQCLWQQSQSWNNQDQYFSFHIQKDQHHWKICASILTGKSAVADSSAWPASWLGHTSPLQSKKSWWKCDL